MGSRDVAVCYDSRSDSICSSLSASLRLCYWQKPPPTITVPSPCFTIGVILGVAALSPTLSRAWTLLFDRKISNFDLSVRRTLFHRSIVQSLYILAHWCLLILFCFLNSGLLTAILSYRPASQSLFLAVDVDTFFHVCSVV